nr:acyl-ACP thioesterase domain-containing protein [Mycolicibacterium septicum]
MSLVEPLPPMPEGHPDVFDRSWPLRVADVDATGRLRLDAAARHIHDIGQDQAMECAARACPGGRTAHHRSACPPPGPSIRSSDAETESVWRDCVGSTPNATVSSRIVRGSFKRPP